MKLLHVPGAEESRKKFTEQSGQYLLPNAPTCFCPRCSEVHRGKALKDMRPVSEAQRTGGDTGEMSLCSLLVPWPAAAVWCLSVVMFRIRWLFVVFSQRVAGGRISARCEAALLQGQLLRPLLLLLRLLSVITIATATTTDVFHRSATTAGSPNKGAVAGRRKSPTSGL